MRWKQRNVIQWINTEESDWHRTFAWKPVSIGGQWVWLEWVERKLTANGLDWAKHFRIPA